MSKVVDIQDYRRQSAESPAFKPWKKRFGEGYDRHTRLRDVSDRVLGFLASPGDDSAAAYYDMIMGALGMGPGGKFTHLSPADQTRIVDIHLFIADRVRYEMVFRLGWIIDYPTRDLPLIEMVLEYDRLKSAGGEHPPRLSPDHPGYAEFNTLNARDQEAFVRRLLPDALATFLPQDE